CATPRYRGRACARPSQANSERPPPGTSSTSSMKGLGLSSTGSTTQPRPGSRRSAGALHPGTADELVLVPPRQALNAISGNVEHQLDEGFRVVEHPLDDTAPPKIQAYGCATPRHGGLCARQTL